MTKFNYPFSIIYFGHKMMDENHYKRIDEIIKEEPIDYKYVVRAKIIVLQNGYMMDFVVVTLENC